MSSYTWGSETQVTDPSDKVPTVIKPPQLRGEASIPLYQQLKGWFVEQIQSGSWTSEALPSERVLSESFGISRDTVRRAVDSLERDGWVEKRHGKGTFVTPPKIEQSLSRLSGFSENMRRAGLKSSSKVLSATLQEPSDAVRRFLALPPGGVVAVVTRLRSVAGDPVMLERSHVTYSLTPKLLEHDLSRSLYTILTDVYRLELTKGEESLELAWANKKMAKLLGIKKGDALFYTRRLVTNEQGLPIEYAERHARADKCKFTVTLSADRADFAIKDGA